MRFAHDGGLSCTSHEFAEAAIRHADLPTLRAAEELGMQLTQNQTSVLSRTAAAQQSLPLLQWLGTQPQCKLADGIGMHAVKGGASVEVLRWLSQQGVTFDSFTMYAAAERNHFAAMQYLHSVGCPWSVDIVSFAAERGDFEMLRWACEHGDAGWSPLHVLNKAAASGSVEMTAWVAQQPGVKLMASTMCAAAAKGHTAVCEYLLSQQCPMTAYACTRAAAGNHMGTLQWLRDNGCPGAVDAFGTTTSSSVSVLPAAARERVLNGLEEACNSLFSSGLSG